ncbi:MAG: electron transfer flavoprotein subunit alpha/FixB family protein [Synergistaceae bacterium]|nr:electron transfer flavoprotein subunit alpha/FixB family protein [Synergistaceae bacterium]
MLRTSVVSKGILVCGEVRRGKIHSVTMELVGKARQLADKKNCGVSCLLFCGELDDAPEKLFGYGADRVVLVAHASLKYFNQDIAAKLLAHVIKEMSPEIVLAPATTSGRTYLPAAAAMVHTGLTADCTGLDIDDETGLLLQTRPAIGGNVMATIKTPDFVPQMSTVRPKTFRVPEPCERGGELVTPDIPSNVFESDIEVLSMEYSEGDVSDIQDKDVVVSGGKGLKRPENFALVGALAEALDGAVGASRPTVEAKWIDYAHQVGLSGKVVSPKIYIAAGISGAVQHLAGMQTAQKIIAINKDPDAPIFRVADVALCGDLNDILPRLTERIKKEARRS